MMLGVNYVIYSGLMTMVWHSEMTIANRLV